jgi:hypothetical protein
MPKGHIRHNRCGTDGCEKQTLKNEKDVYCRDHIFTVHGVIDANHPPYNKKRMPVYYRDPVTQEIEQFVYSGGNPIIPFELAVKPGLSPKAHSQCDIKFKGRTEKDRERSRQARKNKPEIGNPVCAEDDCSNYPYKGVSGCRCMSCAIDICFWCFGRWRRGGFQIL